MPEGNNEGPLLPIRGKLVGKLLPTEGELMGELMPVGGCAEEESVVLAALGKAPAGTGLFCEGGTIRVGA